MLVTAVLFSFVGGCPGALEIAKGICGSLWVRMAGGYGLKREKSMYGKINKILTHGLSHRSRTRIHACRDASMDTWRTRKKKGKREEEREHIISSYALLFLSYQSAIRSSLFVISQFRVRTYTERDFFSSSSSLLPLSKSLFSVFFPREDYESRLRTISRNCMASFRIDYENPGKISEIEKYLSTRDTLR